VRGCAWACVQHVRAECNPTGPGFADFITAMCGGYYCRMHRLMRYFGTSRKLVLRKLVAAILPRGCARKRAFVREVLHVTVASSTEQLWTVAECVSMLHAVCVRAPQHACIPTELRTRTRVFVVPGRKLP
jgi:hypothetical protein